MDVCKQAQGRAGVAVREVYGAERELGAIKLKLPGADSGDGDGNGAGRGGMVVAECETPGL